MLSRMAVVTCVALLGSACSDSSGNRGREDVEDASDETTAPEVTDPTPVACQATLTEVDGGFVEIVARGECADWSLAIRDGATTGCALAAEVFFPHDRERVALEGFGVPASAVIVMQDDKLRPVAVWTVGTCEPDPSCLAFIGDDDARPERTACLPADTAAGSVSLCGAQWVADKAPTPGADNHCACAVDCQKAAGFCQLGACVDGACAFSPRAEGETCDDGNLCTTGDRCAAGACVGETVTCAPPAGPCAEPGQCAPATGACVYVDTCADDAECTAQGCQCRPGFGGDGVTACSDLDECALGDTGCHPLAHCVNNVGGYLCVCPLGYAGDGTSCTPTTCACPWESPASCGEAFNRLRVRVTDIWAQPLSGATLALVDVASGQPIRAEALAGFEIDEPLCAARDFALSVEAAEHHAFSGTIHWLENDITLSSTPSPDYAWAVSWDDAGPIVWIGLAHRWFSAAGYPARRDNRLEMLMDGEAGWGSLFADLQLAERLVTGASWWWTSELELVRPANHLTLDPVTRWDHTVLGALDNLFGVHKKILVGQFISQDGIFSNISVDDALLDRAATAGDDFEYMGQANPAAGEFTVTPPVIDFAGRVIASHPDAGDLIDEAPADPWRAPIAVDPTELPLGLSIFDLPIASWHQKFWTIDQEVAYVGGMNAKTSDWDSSEHRVFDPRRMELDADLDDRRAVERKEEEPDFPPRKDYVVRMEGPIVQDVVDVFDRRWQHQLDEDVEYANLATPITIDPTTRRFPGGVQAQIVATMPDPFDDNTILETLMRAIGNARHLIYIEDQYFRAPILYDAIVARMTEVPTLRLVVVTNDVSEWTDPGCWQTAIAHQRFRSLFRERFRIYRLRSFDYVRTDCTFCWDETEAHFVDHDMHSKLVIIDDVYLEVGSCNSNNRGLLYEGELAIAVHDPTWVAARRKRIFENLLGPGYAGDMPFSDVIAAFDERAHENRIAYERWDDEGMDLDLDGAAVPADMLPSGFVYPLAFDAPDECLIEGVGVDVM